MGRYLNVIVITIVIVFCGCSCSKQAYRYNYEPKLELGERFMGIDSSCNRTTIITPFNADTLIRREVYKDSIHYVLGIDDQNIIKYIWCTQYGATLGGYTLTNRPVSEVNGDGKIKLRSESNKFYIELKDGWWLEMEAYKDRDDDFAVRISGGGTVIKYSEWE